MRLVAVQRWPVVPKAPQTRAFQRQFEIGVIEHDHRILAAQLQRAAFQLLRAGRSHHPAHRRGAGERNRANVRMRGQRGADFAAEAGDDIDHACRDAGFG